MMESTLSWLSLKSPVIYVAAAFVITIAAAVAGYVYITQKQEKTTQSQTQKQSHSRTGKLPSAGAPSKNEPEAKQEPFNGRPGKGESKQDIDLSMAAGQWPVDTNVNDADDGKGDAVSTGGEDTKPERDPVEFCSHLQSEVKRTKQKLAMAKVEEEMTAEQKNNESQVQKDQLAAIYQMMQTQEEKFGVESMDDIKTQMKLYI